MQKRGVLRFRQSIAALCLLATACGGGGSTAQPPPTGGTPTPSPTPTPPAATCSLRARQDWAAAQIREWYLFPELLVTGLDPANYTSVDAYIDALTATARAQGRDRGFTYLTSIAEENAFNSRGETAAFGIRLSYEPTNRRATIAETFEGSPALAAGLDRGMELIAVGTSAATLRSVDSLMASGGSAAVSEALGPGTAGLSRTLQVRRNGSIDTLTLTKAVFDIPPVSPRYGTRVFMGQDGVQVGYVNLRTFISTADAPLRDAFASFASRGITRIIVDVRYNGGGLLSTAERMGDLMGGNRLASDVFSRTVFRPEKSASNSTRLFRPDGNAARPTRLAFISTAATASASELVANAFSPYLRADNALVGSNSSGKPVGQIARDRPECDDRLRITALATQNADGVGDYYNGLASRMPATCAAFDDHQQPLGDRFEDSIMKAMDFMAGRACTPIDATAKAEATGATPRALQPAHPSAAQRQVPGLY